MGAIRVGLLFVALLASAHSATDSDSLLQTASAVSHGSSVPARYFEDAVVPVAARRSGTRQKVLETPQDVVAPFDVGSDAVPMPKWMIEESQTSHNPLVLAQSTAIRSPSKENGPPMSLTQSNVTSPPAASPPPAQFSEQHVESAQQPLPRLPEQEPVQSAVDAGAFRNSIGTRDLLPSALEVVVTEPPLAAQASVTEAPNTNAMAALPETQAADRIQAPAYDASLRRRENQVDPNLPEAPAYDASLRRRENQVDPNSPEVAARFVECQADAAGDDCMSAMKEAQQVQAFVATGEAKAETELAEANLDKAIAAENIPKLRDALYSAKKAGVKDAKMKEGESKMYDMIQAGQESLKHVDPETLKRIEQARVNALDKLQEDARKRAAMLQQIDALEQRRANLLGVAKLNHWITAPGSAPRSENSARQFQALADEMSDAELAAGSVNRPSQPLLSQSRRALQPMVDMQARIPRERLARLDQNLAQLSSRLLETERLMTIESGGSSI